MQYHIVGIAGAGMSGIASMLLDQGHRVSGSDVNTNTLTAALAERGAVVHVGHDPLYIKGADALITTSAARADHPELVAAREAGIPVLKRADVWRTWSHERSIIAVAGTHGKTTTAAMLALVLTRMGMDAGFVIGGEFAQLGTNARWGDPTAPLVIEADEYDHTFLGLFPDIAVITYIEWDHPDIYPTQAAYDAAFAQFMTQVRQRIILSEQAYARKSDSVRLAHGFEPGTEAIAHAQAQMQAQIVTYGTSEGNDYRAVPDDGGQADAWKIEHCDPSSPLYHTRFSLHVPGTHNIHNGMAVLCVVDWLGLDIAAAVHHLSSFRGVARRFDVKGEMGGVAIIDDYAHHPSEVKATLAAARARYGPRRIVAYIQPHTFSRTQALLDMWPSALEEADLVLVGAIYASRETGRMAGTVTVGQDDRRDEERLALELVKHIAAQRDEVAYVGTIEEAVENVPRLLHPGDVLITMGAGDGFRVGERALQSLSV